MGDLGAEFEERGGSLVGVGESRRIEGDDGGILTLIKGCKDVEKFYIGVFTRPSSQSVSQSLSLAVGESRTRALSSRLL